jgi:hypothetical protein
MGSCWLEVGARYASYSPFFPKTFITKESLPSFITDNNALFELKSCDIAAR